MNFTDLIKARYSVRKFDPKPIEPEKLNAVLQAARLAPTAVNAQAYHMYVVQSPEGMEKMRSLTPCHYGAPVVLIFTKNTQQEWHHPQLPEVVSGVQDAAIVATHAMLAATEQVWGRVGLISFRRRRFRARITCRITKSRCYLCPWATRPQIVPRQTATHYAKI